ncbi:chemotaxis protein CheB [Stenotrophomonas lactitubi]|uniref:chemotaxis protein CheB n=1 Tax=Stenotrophomonas lactitubi TaxID=2045214 RepID=UPI001DBAAF3D|nr:chemotaxis protein CheB [Stenotrophomonas lactitubi]CAH0268618.1 Chemotaxis response regulator protein-glutamate methylesterase [Stenotrophomonas lactitubi]CAH0273256.1 Chemotaxis response regulator protein-glutamate methylesterase [Stenotrophomonas lactitubi]CAH0278193.1 Chemotaxis response regulator protein-glutamate methylesterase [Stenotrophomonas lactitubi]CAH0278555.1 Chemotaxis response regulator protein-glutamate methylesterase [Stenotrophomonas lactitubi]
MSVSDLDPVPAVALLARPGAARERLREALAHADVQIVLEDDPITLEAQALHDARPQFVVIALEAAIEDALERLEPALSAPGLTLVFDEAELAARRDGWEAQRWGRHLAAKLHGHQQVLPPGAEDEPALQLEPGRPSTPPVPKEAALQPHLEQARSWADDVPADGLYSPPAHLHEPIALEQALAALQPVLPETAAPVEATLEPPPVPAAAPSVFTDHTAWSLVDEASDAPADPRAAAMVAAPEPAFDTEHLSLVDLDAAAPAGSRAGALLVLAGIGGPDALRRLLAALPSGLAVPVLVHMRLDGGRYGNLVKQMARVSPLPVQLAEAGQRATAGEVHVLADDIGVHAAADGLYFQTEAQGISIDALSAEHSALVLLSGADLAHVGPALDLAAAGAWVAGQVGEGCYDPAAATAVVAAGMAAGEPQELAQVIAARWGLDDDGDAA